MKKLNYSVSFIMSSFCLMGSLSALSLSMGRLGEAQIHEGIHWQSIYYAETDSKLVAQIPGEPICDFNQGNCFMQSSYQNTTYKIHSTPAKDTPLPATLEEFINQYQSIPNAHVYAISSNQPHVKYALQIHIMDDSLANIQKIFQVYATQDAIYYATVQGGDYSLTNDFFNSMQVEKLNN